MDRSKQPNYLYQSQQLQIIRHILFFQLWLWENATKLLQVKWWWPALPAWDVCWLCSVQALRRQIIAENCEIQINAENCEIQIIAENCEMETKLGRDRQHLRLPEGKLGHPQSLRILGSRSSTTRPQTPGKVGLNFRRKNVARFTSARFPRFPRLKPSLSGPRRNTGALHVVNNFMNFQIIYFVSGKNAVLFGTWMPLV